MTFTTRTHSCSKGLCFIYEVTITKRYIGPCDQRGKPGHGRIPGSPRRKGKKGKRP